MIIGINLIDKISEHDKKVLNAYINSYGCQLKDFIGIDAWLQNWSHSNQKLYHLLGDSFIKEFPFKYKKDNGTIFSETRKFMKKIISKSPPDKQKNS